MIVSYLIDGEQRPIDTRIEKEIIKYSDLKLMEVIYGIQSDEGCGEGLGVSEKYFIITTTKEMLRHMREGNPYLCDIDENTIRNIINKI